MPCPPFPRFYSSMKECRARLRFAPRGRKERGEEGRKDDRVNIYPARNLIRRRGYRGWGIGLKILFPVQRLLEFQDGSGWRFEKWGSELASRKVKRDVERNERIDEKYVVYIGRWSEQSPFNWVIRHPLNRTRSEHPLENTWTDAIKSPIGESGSHRIWVVNNCSMLNEMMRDISFRMIGKITRIRMFFCCLDIGDVLHWEAEEEVIRRGNRYRISLDRVNFNSGNESLTLLLTFNITSSREFLFNSTLVTIFNLPSRIRSIQ